MLTDRTRRLELGKTILDVAKYVLTIVVIRGLVSNPFDIYSIAFGTILVLGLGLIGFLAIPEEES